MSSWPIDIYSSHVCSILHSLLPSFSIHLSYWESVLYSTFLVCSLFLFFHSKFIIILLVFPVDWSFMRADNALTGNRPCLTELFSLMNLKNHPPCIKLPIPIGEVVQFCALTSTLLALTRSSFPSFFFSFYSLLVLIPFLYYCLLLLSRIIYSRQRHRLSHLFRQSLHPSWEHHIPVPQ